METQDALVIGGGQSGLAAALALRASGAEPVVLEAAARPGGSWPRYYDSLNLFSPARYSGLPGLPFPGDPDRYPRRDEVTAYLRDSAARLDAEIRTTSRATAVTADGPFLVVRLDSGQELRARAVIAATGSFSNPHVPSLVPPSYRQSACPLGTASARPTASG
ncbi:MAG TPA: NAD(P)-binding domain-containing protein [Trebonia sp.]